MSRNTKIGNIMDLEEELRIIQVHRYKKEELEMCTDMELHRRETNLNRWKSSQNSSG